MNIKCGTDIIEIKRIKDDIEKLGEKFLNRIYTKKEIEYCESKKSQKYQSYAVRFAAKEAIYKAISSQLESKHSIEWKKLEILNDDNGRPVIQVHYSNLKIDTIDVSLSHCNEYAIATVIVIFN